MKEIESSYELDLRQPAIGAQNKCLQQRRIGEELQRMIMTEHINSSIQSYRPVDTIV